MEAEAIVQRVELVGGDPVRWAGTGEVAYYARTDVMVSFESATVPHACPNASADSHKAFADAPPCDVCGSIDPHMHDERGEYVPLRRFP